MGQEEEKISIVMSVLGLVASRGWHSEPVIAEHPILLERSAGAHRVKVNLDSVIEVYETLGGNAKFGKPFEKITFNEFLEKAA